MHDIENEPHISEVADSAADAEKTQIMECPPITRQMPCARKRDEHALPDTPADSAAKRQDASGLLTTPDSAPTQGVPTYGARTSNEVSHEQASHDQSPHDGASSETSHVMNGAHEEHSENTASSIPLYSTQPSVSASAFHENPRMLGEQSRQTYIQVPHEPRAQRPILQKTGSSVATIVLGSLLLVLGVIALVLGMQFPLTLFSSFGADPRMMIALGCAAIGGVLLVVAAGWSLASFIRNRTMSADTNDDGDFDAKDADGRVGDDGNDAYDDGRVSRG